MPHDLAQPCDELDDLPEPLEGRSVALWIEGTITSYGECAVKADRLTEAYGGGKN